MASTYPSIDPNMIPAGVPPPGVMPNFVNPPTREELPKILVYVTLPPMLLFLGLRVYTRIKYTVLGLDDGKSGPTLLYFAVLTFHSSLCSFWGELGSLDIRFIHSNELGQMAIIVHIGLSFVSKLASDALSMGGLF